MTVMSALCTLSELSIIENIAGHTARPLLRFAAVQFFKGVQHPAGLAPKGRFIATEAIERKIGEISESQETAGELDSWGIWFQSRGGNRFYFAQGPVRNSLPPPRIVSSKQRLNNVI